MLMDQVQQTFQYVSDVPLKSVSVAGTFNVWNKDATPLKLDSDGRTWSVKLSVPYGKVQYKFVIDGEKWITDPRNSAVAADGNGNSNSVILIAPAGYERPASPVDGITASSALKHETGVKWVNYDQGRLTFSLRARPNDLQAVSLVVNGKPVPMKVQGEDELFATYVTSMPWGRKTDLRYQFRLRDGSQTEFFGPQGLAESKTNAFSLRAKEFRPYVVPDWVEKSVVYQIFPDRFANGSTANDDPKTMPWDGKPTWYNTFGGDVAGIESHLDYLKKLGVSAVYFNPVFKSPSVHRYDATDFKLVDPKFGTNEEFAALTHRLKEAGIRTIMDFAFNHTAVDFAPFMDIRTRGEASPYKNWYWIKSYPVEVRNNPPYAAWYGFASMPKLNVMNPETHQFVLGVVDFWKQTASLDGIRLDVANEVDPQMWRDLRTHVKPQSPETWILGEEWGDASAWLGGDQWDASMNYRFRGACLDFFAHNQGDGREFLNRQLSLYSSLPPQVSRNQLNLLCSHDTARFLTDCQGDARLANLARVFQMTWAGTPSVYYGEELGMEGGGDPDNRRGMRWDLATDANPTLQLFRQLIFARNSSRELQSGEPIALATSGKAFAFARRLGNRGAIVAINRGEAAVTLDIEIPSEIRSSGFRDPLSGKSYQADHHKISLSLPPLQAAILLPSAASPSSRTFAQTTVRRSHLK